MLVGARRRNQKVYKGRLSQPQRAEVVNLYQNGVLIKGNKIIANCFSLIYADTKIEAATICESCDQIFSLSTTVRSTLYKHKKIHDDHEHIDNSVQPPAYLKVQLTKSLAEMVAIDVLPFSIVENFGIRNVLDLVYKAGFNLGKVAAKTKSSTDNPSIAAYIPSRFTVKKFVGDYVAHVLPAFKAHVLKHIQDYGAAITMDFGTKDSNYFACTVHFFNSEWELTSWTLNFSEFDKKSTDAEQVKRNLIFILQQYGIDISLVRRNIIFTN